MQQGGLAEQSAESVGHKNQIRRTASRCALHLLKHMEMVAWLKSEHQMGHGHANALVAHFRNQESV